MPVAIEYFGAQAVGSYLLEEAGETALEATTGIILITDPVDIVEQGIKKSARGVDIVEQGVKKSEGFRTIGAAAKGFSKIPKGFKEVKEFGYQHGQKVYSYKGKYYSRDVDGHNGGAWKVFENQGGKLKRIGTADHNLNIFKK